MLLSADIFESAPDARLGWDDFDLSKSPRSGFFPKLLDNSYPAFDVRAPTVPSLSLESLAMVPSALALNETEEDLLLESMAGGPDSMVMEFDAQGQLVHHEPLLEATTDYYYANFLSWEDDLFSAALHVPLEVVTPQAIVTVVAEDSSDSDLSSSDSDLSSSDSESEVEVRPIRRKRLSSSSRRKRTSPDSKAPRRRTPSGRREDNKRRRRPSYHSADVNELSISVEILENDSEVETTFCPTPIKGPIGQISKSTHGVSAEVIRTIFQAEQIVTLSKNDDEEDEEEVDIM